MDERKEEDIQRVRCGRSSTRTAGRRGEKGLDEMDATKKGREERGIASCPTLEFEGAWPSRERRVGRDNWGREKSRWRRPRPPLAGGGSRKEREGAKE